MTWKTCASLLAVSAAIALQGPALAGEGSNCDNAKPALSPDADDIGLSACLARPAAVYAVGEALTLVLTARRDAVIELWLETPDGDLRRWPGADTPQMVRLRAGVATQVPARDMAPLVLGPGHGSYKIHVIARRAETVSSRSLTSADERLAGRNQREERRIALQVVQP